MIKINDNTYCRTFEYFYLFVMVIYMGQMTRETSRMVGGLKGSLLPLLIPIVLTIILLFRHYVNFLHKRLWMFTGIMLGWSIAVCYKFNDFSTGNESYYVFLIYAIVIAFIHIRVFGRDLFHIYEHIMVVLSAISLVFWGMSILLPYTDSLFQSFPETQQGHNIFYLYNWSGITDNFRNYGCSWEPGRFSIMLIPAILVNLSRRGVTFVKNKNVIILLLALASTMSTTGYSIAILLYGIFWFEKITVKKSLIFVVFILPIFAYLFSLDFMTEKIQEKADFRGLDAERLEDFEYYEQKRGDEYVASLDRFESASFEWMNFQHDPLLGYGRSKKHSWFYQELSMNMEMTSGLVKVLSQYGIFIGILLYLILFYSSIMISRAFLHQRWFVFALALILCSVSYTIFSVPIFTAFWLYGLFCRKDEKKDARLLISRRKLPYTQDKYLQ